MADRTDSPRPGSRVAVAVGVAAIAVFFLGFGGWATMAPLDSAVVATGVVTAESERKTIQHLEGGIISEILVRDGDRVTAGQVLVRLDSTQADAKLDLLRRRHDVAIARQARLEAQHGDLPGIRFPDELLARRDDPSVAELIMTQNDLFRERREGQRGQVAILEGRIEQLRSEISGLDGSIDAQDRELALLTEEIGDLKKLFAKGVVPKARMLALQRRAAEVEGNRSRNVASRLRARQEIDEARLQIVSMRTTVASEAAAQLDEIRAELQDLGEQLRAAEDVKKRSAVVAPHGGLVVNRRVHTPGGVIGPGEALLDIVPSDDRLVVEARIDPTDADIVSPGLEAYVRITSFNQRHIQPLLGRLVHVSADRLVDSKTGQPYYGARVELPADRAVANGTGHVTPGMPAEVMILAGERTMMDYLLEPFTTALRRAVREP